MLLIHLDPSDELFKDVGPIFPMTHHQFWEVAGMGFATTITIRNLLQYDISGTSPVRRLGGRA